MLNGLETIMTRRSAGKLADPAPSAEALAKAFDAAALAPDHGRLKPWRFFVVQGAGLDRLGDLLVETMKKREPDAAPDALQRERDKAKRAPAIVVAAAKIQTGHKIPEVEQLLAAGAATQNLWLALHAQGYGCMWKTGAPAYDPAVKAAFGLAEHDKIVGFIYTGTVAAMPPALNRPTGAQFASPWGGA